MKRGDAAKAKAKAKKAATEAKAIARTPRAELLTVASLDAAVREVKAIAADTMASFAAHQHRLGTKLLEISTKGLWKLRLDESGKARWKNWHQFAHHELGMPDAYVYELMRIAEQFTEQQAVAVGKSKLALIAKAPKELHAGLIAMVTDKGASAREVKAAVESEKRKTGYQKPARSGRKTPHNAGRPKNKPSATTTDKGSAATTAPAERVTIAMVNKRSEIPLYGKPASWSGLTIEDDNTLPGHERAHGIDDVPFGALLLANDALMFVIVQKREEGLVAIVDVRREDAT